MLLNICYHIAPKAPTVQASMVCDHFGLTLDGQQQVIARDLELPVTSGNLIAFVGPSGSGKSSLMRAVAAELKSSGQGDVLWLDHLPQVASLVADALALPPLDAFRLLAQCGLAEPQLLLRTPDELSDGQRFRFRLAQSVAEALRRQSQHSSQGTWIAADEFTSPLDRTLAKVMARNWHSLLRQHRLGGLVATTHTDILDDLEPDLIVTCSHDAPPQLSGLAASPTFSSATSSAQRTLREADAPTPAVKKKKSAFSTNWPSPPERNATGRILLGGITARTPSALSASSPSSGISTNP
ncbi:AAA ATPase [Planctopirus limnophila DSM 3776]|uniref:AAA ATPase n=1 Tax=Planctopirus limnophila (strain ATCC 43296 / DSM 3776 / IFAM 1008 / Mu 290) TaxID=521674 RepID=D5SVR2_PLAL2|nr:ATP-binding cassette domain-containing protein [Planctopirus limnophila]ADG69422.1 AAA ATPase [Planctopirus limnophila DSM 3776]